MGKSYIDDKVVWLDAKKERSEMRAARVIHRIAKVLEETERLREDTLAVTKHVGGKYVTVNGQRACFTLHGSVKWTAWATARYPKPDLDWMQGFAEAN
jgi:hypothetical protein